jgi:hypothetical protein
MKKMTIGDIKPKEDDDSHSIHEDSSDDDDDNDDQPRRPTSSPTRQDSPSSSRAGRPATYRTERTAENSRHVRAVLPVRRLVEQLRSYVVQRCSHNCKKT